MHPRIIRNGSVKLIDHMGNDLRIVNAARRSFRKESDALKGNDIGLINFLMRERHGTPFESVVFTFGVHAPVAVAREWVRHRISSWNELSGRYVELPPDFMMPQMRIQKGKPGSYTFEDIEGQESIDAEFIIQDAYDHCWSAYSRLLEMGIAKEVARYVLPVGIFTEWYWTVNARSLMNFLNLRNSPHAMKEIRDLAADIEKIFCSVLPHTAAAFQANKRVAP